MLDHIYLTQEQLELIRTREANATPAPWSFNTYNTILDSSGHKIIMEIVDHPQDQEWATDENLKRSDWYKESENNAYFVETARMAIPRLVADLEALRAQNDELKARLLFLSGN